MEKIDVFSKWFHKWVNTVQIILNNVISKLNILVTLIA